MRAYLVRLKKDKELVGIFCCDLANLPYFIDECTVVSYCEYTPMKQGGIMWTDSGANKVPLVTEEGTGETEVPMFDGASISESWIMSLMEEDSTWKPADEIETPCLVGVR